MVYGVRISKKELNGRLPKEKVVAEFIIRIPGGGCVTVVHQDVPPAEGQNCEMGWRIGSNYTWEKLRSRLSLLQTGALEK